MTNIVDVERSNRLPELAARIKEEHEATAVALQRGLEHALAAGKMLIEAKALLKHGQWLPWLAEHCAMSERTAQAYMQVAHSFAKIGDEAKAQRVADLGFRDALHSLAATGSILGQLPPESYDRALQTVEDPENAETLHHVVRRVRKDNLRARNGGSLETPASMLPTNGRKIRVARNPEPRQWLLAIGPDITRAALKEKEQAARATETVTQLEQEHSELLSRAEALEVEAKALREDAGAVGSLIAAAVKKTIGPVAPFTETYDFQCDEQTDAELARLPQRQLVDRCYRQEARSAKVSKKPSAVTGATWRSFRLNRSIPARMVPVPAAGQRSARRNGSKGCSPT